MPEAAREVLLDSKAAGSTSPSLRAGMLLCGLLLLGSCFYDFFGQDKNFRETFPKLVVGIAFAYGAGFRKKIYLAPEGIVRRTRGWFSANEELLRWDQVRHVTLALRNDDVMAFFEKDTMMGWKVPCRREDEGALRRILKERIPDTEVNTLGR